MAFDRYYHDSSGRHAFPVLARIATSARFLRSLLSAAELHHRINNLSQYDERGRPFLFSQLADARVDWPQVTLPLVLLRTEN